MTTVEALASEIERLGESMEERIATLESDFATLKIQYQEIMEASQTQGQSESKGFPIFSGDDLDGWVFDCSNYFISKNTPVEDRVELACLHMQGRALPWRKIWTTKFKKDEESVSWDDYLDALQQRFGDKYSGNTTEELLNLRQIGSVEADLDIFERLLVDVNIEEESTAVGFFLNGLKPDIRRMMKIHNPKSLAEAVALARKFT